MPGTLDMMFHNARASLGLGPLVPPTEAEVAASLAAKSAAEEARRLSEEAFLAAGPRYALGDGGFGRSERLLGRCASGVEADGGRRLHILGEGQDRAICGAKDGSMTSVGWSGPRAEPASCPRCLTKMGGAQC